MRLYRYKVRPKICFIPSDTEVRPKICFIPSGARSQYWVLIPSVAGLCLFSCSALLAGCCVTEASPSSSGSHHQTHFVVCLFFFLLIWFYLFLIKYFWNPRIIFHAFTDFLWCVKCCYDFPGRSVNVVCSSSFRLAQLQWFTLSIGVDW